MFCITCMWYVRKQKKKVSGRDSSKRAWNYVDQKHACCHPKRCLKSEIYWNPPIHPAIHTAHEIHPPIHTAHEIPGTVFLPKQLTAQGTSTPIDRNPQHSRTYCRCDSPVQRRKHHRHDHQYHHSSILNFFQHRK